MTKEEAKIILDLINTTEHFITKVIALHLKALRDTINNLTQEE